MNKEIIPIEIKAHNFLSYKDVTINYGDIAGFTGVVGNTGAGKSALFTDTITYLIWGESRFGAKSAKDLKNWTARKDADMWVSGNFKVDNNLIRVTRGLTGKNKPGIVRIL